jgi:hypothetical protein
MENPRLVNLENQPTNFILRRLMNQTTDIFGQFNHADYQNLVAIFTRLRNDPNLNEEHADRLREFIDDGILVIARGYDDGMPIHPGTMNIVMMAIQVLNQAEGHPEGHPYQVRVIPNITPPTEDFMNEVVRPITERLVLLPLHHAEWINPVFAAQEAARRAFEEAPGAETRIARTLAEFRAMGSNQTETTCPVCMENFIEHNPKGRSPVFMPVIFHKNEKGKWFHPMHTACVDDMKKEACPICRVKVVWPEKFDPASVINFKDLMLIQKKRHPNSDPSVRKSLKRSVKRLPNVSLKQAKTQLKALHRQMQQMQLPSSAAKSKTSRRTPYSVGGKRSNHRIIKRRK